MVITYGLDKFLFKTFGYLLAWRVIHSGPFG